MNELKEIDLFLIAFGLLPGFVSMQVFALLQPSESTRLKDNVLEAISFGVFNLIAVSALLSLGGIGPFQPLNPQDYAVAMGALLLGSLAWPIALYKALAILASRGVILRRARNAWDDYFQRKQPCWIVVHLKDGRKIGGWFGSNSYASVYPHSGHLYIESLWRLDDEGRFIEEVAGSKGIVLRPDDYMMIELFNER